MSQGDLLADRKRLKRALHSWRTVAILAVLVALVVVAQQYGGKAGGTGMPGKSYIAQVTIEDMMLDDPERDALLEEIAEDTNAKALLVRLNSPGGTTVAGEELYLQLRKVAEKKPVVGVMRTVCASACYMASLGTDHAIARESTLTGSIGVLLQSVEVSELAKKLGVEPITITSGKYKDVPSFTKKFTDDERTVVRQLVDDAYAHFVDLIAERRKMDRERVLTLADGRVYTGRQAMPLGLIDGLGGMDEAVKWLETEKKLPKDMEIREMEVKPEFDSLFSALSQWTGIEIFGQSTLALDGLVSMWQHPLTQ